MKKHPKRGHVSIPLLKKTPDNCRLEFDFSAPTKPISRRTFTKFMRSRHARLLRWCQNKYFELDPYHFKDMQLRSMIGKFLEMNRLRAYKRNVSK